MGDELETGDALSTPFYGWYLNAKLSNREIGTSGEASPLITSEDALIYTDYAGSGNGQVVKIDSAVAYITDYRSTDWAVNDGNGDTLKIGAQGSAIYTAFLYKPLIQSKQGSYRDFFGYEFSTTTNVSRGRIFQKYTEEDGSIQFGVSKNESSYMGTNPMDTAMTIVNGVNKTYLMVLKYEVGDLLVENDDTIKLFINPDPTLPEASQIHLISEDAANDRPEGTVVRLQIRQRGINGLISGIRVGTNWEDVVDGSGGKNSYSTLSELKVDGSFVNGFSPLVYTYKVGVAPDFSTLPVVTASPTFSGASVAIDNVTAIPGVATVVVTAENGDKQTYSINFSGDYYTSSIATSIDKPLVYQSNGDLTIKSSNELLNSSIELVDLYGRIIYSDRISSNLEQIHLNNAKGILIVRIISTNAQQVYTQKIVVR